MVAVQMPECPVSEKRLDDGCSSICWRSSVSFQSLFRVSEFPATVTGTDLISPHVATLLVRLRTHPQPGELELRVARQQ